MRNAPPGRPGPFRGPPGPAPRGPGGRPYRPKPAANNPLPLILGIGGGVLALVLVLVVMSSGNKEPAPVETAPPPEAAPPPPKPVDVSGLEREGHKYCDEGLAVIRSLESKIAVDANTLSNVEKAQLKADLKKGIDLIHKGLGFINEANEKSGRGYDLNKYIQALKLASNKYNGLGGSN